MQLSNVITSAPGQPGRCVWLNATNQWHYHHCRPYSLLYYRTKYVIQGQLSPAALTPKGVLCVKRVLTAKRPLGTMAVNP